MKIHTFLAAFILGCSLAVAPPSASLIWSKVSSVFQSSFSLYSGDNLWDGVAGAMVDTPLRAVLDAGNEYAVPVGRNFCADLGADTAERALGTLRKGGTFTSVAGRVAAEKCAAAGVTCAGGGPPGSGGPSEGQTLTEVGSLATSGALSVHIDQRFPLEKAADAQVLSAAGRTQGKIILIVDAARAGQR